MSASLGAQALPSKKQAELNAAGISNWRAGQNQGQTPVFGKLAASKPTPQALAKDTGPMQYDDGVLSVLPTVFGQIYGNRFSLGKTGVPLSTITLNNFSFYFMEDSIADTNLFFQPAVPGTMASLIDARASVNVGGLMNSGQSFSNPVLNVIPQTVLGTTGMFNNTFFLGAWCLNANATLPVDNEAIGLATNGPRQQGYTAASGTGPVNMNPQSFNAILRANVTSPSTVPVELMDFRVR